jgi:hypothetical protein
MARARRVRASFVVTVAVAAASSGCGGGVSSDGAGGSGGSGGTGNPTCPTTLPSDGAACPSAGLACEYDGGIDECGQPTTYSAVCSKSGTWTVSADYPGMSCNPPPPPQDVCDLYEPTTGMWCDTIPGLVCTYPSTCCPSVYECIDHQWQFTAPPCNPPVPVCPESEPVNGAPCESPCGLTYECSYGGCFDGGVGASSATCSGGTWVVVQLDCG